MGGILGLLSERLVIWDGGMGSELIARGLMSGEAPERWNLQRAADVAAVHRAYFEAGADVVHTNTFGGTPIRLAKAGLADSLAEVNRSAVELALDVRPAGCFLAGDLGPCGEMLAPIGKIGEEEVERSFELQAAALAEAGVDLLHVETMYDLREALAAVRGIRKACSLPLIVSMTYRSTKRGFFTEMGNAVSACVEQLAGAGVDAIGTNCSLEGPAMAELAGEMRGLTSLPLVFQPNAGKPELKQAEVVYDCTPEDFCASIEAIVDAGANGVGGCCGTTPAHIALIAEKLKRA